MLKHRPRLRPLRRPDPPAEQRGQLVIAFALLLVVIVGIVALAVDVGFAYHQRQRQQNLAVDAAEAGAYQVYGFAQFGVPTVTGGAAAPQATPDAQVLAAMIANLQAAGITVHTSAPTGNNPCGAHYSPDEVYVQAEYLDGNNTPIPTPGGGPLLVGSGYYNTSARGVRVLTLSGCSPAYFARVLGRQNYVLSASEQAGQAPAYATPNDTPIPTVTGTQTLGGTATSTVLPTLTSTPTPTSTLIPTATNTATATATPMIADNTGFMVYGQLTDTLYAVNSPHYSTGDTVTLEGNGSYKWSDHQFANSSQGKSGNPGGITVHDTSMVGCYDTTTHTSLIVGDSLDFNHGGAGNCPSTGTQPSNGGVIAIPLVYEVYKNDGSCSQNGGYCEVVTAIVLVQITDNSFPKHVLGQIVGVVSDPSNIVELPAPTATPTSTSTSTATNTPTVTNTPTITPTPTATTGPPLP